MSPLSLLLVLTAVSSSSPCRVPDARVRGQRVLLAPLEISLEVPESWDVNTTVHDGFGVIRDLRSRGCRLTLTSHDGADTATRIRRVHERLYLGRNLISETCGAERLRGHTRRGNALFGEYDRFGRSRVYGMFWSTGSEGFSALVSCPQGAPGDWRTALLIFDSIVRRTP